MHLKEIHSSRNRYDKLERDFVEKGLTDEKTHIRIITMYMRNNNNKKIDVRIRINLLFIFTNISL